MGQISALLEQESGPEEAVARYTSTMHGELTQVEVFTRVADYAFRVFDMGAMELLALRCGTLTMRRDSADIRTRPNGMSTFIHQLRGRSSFRHYGNQIELEEGDFSLCNNSTQYDLHLMGPNEVILFRVPTPMVEDHIPSSQILYGRRLAHHEGLASMAAAMARNLASRDPADLAPEIAEQAGRHLLKVLASSYMALSDDRSSASSVMSGRFWKVKLFIEEQLRNPELSPSFIARRLGLSDRYLRMIFAVSSESPSAYILRRRLEECAAQLGDPRWRNYSITNIAFSWGFNSAPHFTRSFRARYFCSPRDYRQQKLSR